MKRDPSILSLTVLVVVALTRLSTFLLIWGMKLSIVPLMTQISTIDLWTTPTAFSWDKDLPTAWIAAGYLLNSPQFAAFATPAFTGMRSLMQFSIRNFTSSPISSASSFFTENSSSS